MIRTCDQSTNCPDDITGNFSSEADDTLDFITTVFSYAPPKIGHLWTQIECGVTFTSSISQADANQQAAAAAGLCGNCSDLSCGTITTFCNNPQTACLPCPGGGLTCFTVPVGVFCGFRNQASADAAAFNAALLLARDFPVCPGPLNPCTCVGAGYMSTISANVPATWTLIGGTLPPGLAFSGGFQTQTTSIFGIPNTAGTYIFSIQAVGPNGTFAQKTYSITVLQIVTAQLPAPVIGVPYSFQMQATGGSGNYQWRITQGTLPNGLSMDINGLISGTPQ